MRPENVLGQDPTPGSSAAVDRVAGVLRSVVLATAQSRQRLLSAAGPATVWQGPGGSVVGEALEPLIRRLRALEDDVVDFSQAWQRWRDGLAERQALTAELTEAVAATAGDEAAADRREGLLAQVRVLADEHARAATDLEHASDTLVEALAASGGATGDPVSGLASALASLTAGVEQWIADSAGRLDATVVSMEDAAEVTASMSVLLGLGDGHLSERAREVAALAPGSHRLTPALSATWTRDPADLPEASFDEAGAGSLADRLRAPAEARPEEQP